MMSSEVVVLDPAAAGEECRIGVLAESGERDRWRDLGRLFLLVQQQLWRRGEISHGGAPG